MKRKLEVTVAALFLSFCIICGPVVHASAAEYDALNGVKHVKAVFDFGLGNPKEAAAHLKVIDATYKDKALSSITEKPEFVVVFLGPSVRLFSKKSEGFSPQEREILRGIAGTISAMSKDGIKLEMCHIAAGAFGVDASSVLPEIEIVGNGWISIIGYQAQGYSLIPDF